MYQSLKISRHYFQYKNVFTNNTTEQKIIFNKPIHLSRFLYTDSYGVFLIFSTFAEFKKFLTKTPKKKKKRWVI